MLGILLCLFLMAGYYKIILCSLKFCNTDFLGVLKDDLQKILFVSAISIIFIFAMVSQQQTIYIWDSLETWEPMTFCEEITFDNPLQALKNLRSSINHADYNNFLPMLMVLPAHIFGKSFLCYTLYVWIMFGLPAIFLISAWLATYTKIFSCSTFMIIFMLSPIIFVPIFIGYANISILLPVSIIFMMLMNLNKSELQRKPLILIGVLSFFAVFQARTAAYMIVACFIGYTFFIIISSNNLREDIFMLCKKYLYIGISALLIMSPLFFTFIKHAVTYDIGSAYSGYALGQDFFGRIFYHISGLGEIIYIIFAVGIIFGLLNKKFRALTAWIFLWTAVAVILFCKVQVMGWQHYYIMILPFMIMIAIITAQIFSYKKFVGIAIIFILIFNFTQTFLLPNKFSELFNSGYQIPIRNDIPDMKNFVSDLNNLPSDKKIFLLASSGEYNSTSLKKIYVPEKHDALPNLLNTVDVDLRDGFSTEFFDADFIVIFDPIQTHLLPESQTVVVKPAEIILNPSPIAEHFKLIREYKFTPGVGNYPEVTAKVFEKISAFEKSDIDFVENIFTELYPDKNDLFKNRFEKYKQDNF